MLIAFEGIDCVGKTMAIKTIKDVLEKKGYSVCCESDWRFPGNEELKDLLIYENDWTIQMLSVLLARKRSMSALQKRTYEFDVVLHDRYSLSTMVYQHWCLHDTAFQDLLESVTLPYELFYIRPADGYDREKFLKKRYTNDRFDCSDKQKLWLDNYEYLLLNHAELAEKTHMDHVLNWQFSYIVENDGTDKFKERLIQMADKIAERIDAEKRSEL